MGECHVHKDDFFFDAGDQRLAATRTTPTDGSPPRLLALHGLGETASRHRVGYLLDVFAGHGHGSVTFDFSGNGESTGVLTEATLRRRTVEALAAAATLGGDTAPILVGTSMGAHLAASVVPEVRPRGLVLFCPAAYPAGAADLPFDGSLTRPGAYPDSPAYRGLREFDGDLLIIVAGRDEVVPPAVIEGYLDHAERARTTEVIRLDDCDHFVHRWLPDRPTHRKEIEQACLRLLSAEQPARPGLK